MEVAECDVFATRYWPSWNGRQSVFEDYSQVNIVFYTRCAPNIEAI